MPAAAPAAARLPVAQQSEGQEQPEQEVRAARDPGHDLDVDRMDREQKAAGERRCQAPESPQTEQEDQQRSRRVQGHVDGVVPGRPLAEEGAFDHV